jgi:methionyl-tRNA formyltransferase
VRDDAIVIWCQGGTIEVLKLRPEGGAKIGAGEFARGRKLLRGRAGAGAAGPQAPR